MIGALVVRLLTGEAGVMIARIRRITTIYALMGVFALAAFGFLIGALFTWIARHYGVLVTQIGFGAVCLVIVALLFVALGFARRQPKLERSDQLRRDITSIAGVAAASNMPLLIRKVGRRRSLLLVPVAGAGIWAILRAVGSYRRR